METVFVVKKYVDEDSDIVEVFSTRLKAEEHIRELLEDLFEETVSLKKDGALYYYEDEDAGANEGYLLFETKVDIRYPQNQDV
mgnify:CR=1 FL=1|jgi:hypothetical protein